MTEFDVIIAGGGLVGTTTALLLAKLPLNIALIDQKSLTPTSMNSCHDSHSVLTSALNSASIDLLASIQLKAYLNCDGCDYTTLKIHSSQNNHIITFDGLSLGYERLGTIINNGNLKNELLKLISSTNNITRFENQNNPLYCCYESGVSIKNIKNNQLLHTQLLIGADGTHSQVRESANITITTEDCRHHALIATIEVEKNHHDCAQQIFLDTGPLALLPLKSKNTKTQCSLIWSAYPHTIKAISKLKNDAFNDCLTQLIAPFALGKVLSTTKKQIYPLTQKHANHYFQNSTVLVGDAAHTIHPMGGQGVNMGLMDSKNLYLTIQKAIKEKRAFNDQTLWHNYQKQRWHNNNLMLKTMSGLELLFDAQHPYIKTFKNLGMKYFNHIPGVKNLTQQFVSGYLQLKN